MNLKQRLDLELQEFLSLNQNYSFDRMHKEDLEETQEIDQGQEGPKEETQS